MDYLISKFLYFPIEFQRTLICSLTETRISLPSALNQLFQNYKCSITSQTVNVQFASSMLYILWFALLFAKYPQTLYLPLDASLRPLCDGSPSRSSPGKSLLSHLAHKEKIPIFQTVLFLSLIRLLESCGDGTDVDQERTPPSPSGLVCDGTVQISSPVSVLKTDETGRGVNECAHCTVILHTLHINYKYSWHPFIYFNKTVFLMKNPPTSPLKERNKMP